MKLGVIVVHFGASEPTLRCLRSIVRQASECAWSAVVVDNSGNLQAASRADLTDVSVLEAADNPGYGEGANRGTAHLLANGLTADGWIVLNNDVELEDGFLDAAAEALQRPQVGAVGGPIRLSRSDGALWYAGGDVRWWAGTVRQSRRRENAVHAREVGFIPGTAIAIDARAFADIGGFDPGFFLYHEDLDLCLRLRRSGWKLWFEPRMLIVHHMGTTTGSRERSALYLEEMAKTRLRSFRPRSYRVYLAAVHTLWVALRATSLALQPSPGARRGARALLRGHRAALAELFRD